MTGLTVIAIDQLDMLSAQTIGGATGMLGDAADSAQPRILLGQGRSTVSIYLRKTALAHPHGRRLRPATWHLIYDVPPRWCWICFGELLDPAPYPDRRDRAGNHRDTPCRCTDR